MVIPILLFITYFFFAPFVQGMEKDSSGKFLVLSQELKRIDVDPECFLCGEYVVPTNVIVASCQGNLYHGSCALKRAKQNEQYSLLNERKRWCYAGACSAFLDELKKNNEQCGICLELIENKPLAIAPCGHFACLTCEVDYEKSKYSDPVSKSNYCSTCRKSYTPFVSNSSTKKIVHSLVDFVWGIKESIQMMTRNPRTIVFCAQEMFKRANGYED